MKRKYVKSLRPWPRARGEHLVACHFCDTLHEAPLIPEGTGARCSRCGIPLYDNRPASLVRATAFSLASLILAVICNSRCSAPPGN